MPRRSPNDLVVVPLPQFQKPEPPADLEPEVAQVWRETVQPLKADHFHDGMHPLLICYCRSVVASRNLWAERGRRSIGDRGRRQLGLGPLARQDCGTKLDKGLAVPWSA